MILGSVICLRSRSKLTNSQNNGKVLKAQFLIKFSKIVKKRLMRSYTGSIGLFNLLKGSEEIVSGNSDFLKITLIISKQAKYSDFKM